MPVNSARRASLVSEVVDGAAGVVDGGELVVGGELVGGGDVVGGTVAGAVGGDELVGTMLEPGVAASSSAEQAVAVSTRPAMAIVAAA
jgi:hypothetical protein